MFRDRCIVSCGILYPEMKHLMDTGFLNPRQILFTPPGLHAKPDKLERQLLKRLRALFNFRRRFLILGSAIYWPRKVRMMSIVYGPVPSWRLGRSLGVDAVSTPSKTCSFDCIYCQLGRTRHPLTTREVFVQPSQLRQELAEVGDVPIDYVTFSGVAEPTLAANLGESLYGAFPSWEPSASPHGRRYKQSGPRG